MSYRHPHAPLPHLLRLTLVWLVVWAVAFAATALLVLAMGSGVVR